ncbi:MAG: hypothetical protein WAV23_03470 [Minisyncoccia bacterium]
MDTSDKKIIIINGVMGVIGSPIFSYFAEQGENFIYGISRRGFYFEEYVDSSGELPQKDIVFSLADYKKENYEIDIDSFIDALPDLPIVFIHTMGEYVTEMTRDGKLQVENDNDGDGINDNVKRLTYEVPIIFAKKLGKRKSPTTFIQIGSLSDKYKIDIHGSWVKSMDLLKNDLKKISDNNKNFNALILNVSSVLTPKELTDRPYVSLKTNADMRYWLPPTEIAKFIDEYTKSIKTGLHEEELYKKWPNISPDHFSLSKYKERRGKEIYDTLAFEHKDILNLSEGDNISFSFNNPFHMDKLWGDLTILLSRQHKKTQPVIFYNPHPWFFIVRNKTEHEVFSVLNDEGYLVLLTCGSNTYLDKTTLEKELIKYRHKFNISTSTKFENNYNLNIYDDFIIEVTFDKNTSNEIDNFFIKNKEVNPELVKELKDIVSKNGENRLTVYKNKQKAEELRIELSKDFEISAPYKIQ